MKNSTQTERYLELASGLTATPEAIATLVLAETIEKILTNTAPIKKGDLVFNHLLSRLAKTPVTL